MKRDELGLAAAESALGTKKVSQCWQERLSPDFFAEARHARDFSRHLLANVFGILKRHLHDFPVRDALQNAGDCQRQKNDQ